jgi:hypothetical protein
MDDGTQNLLEAIAIFATFEPTFDSLDFKPRLETILSALRRDSGLSEEELRFALHEQMEKVRPR